jgi:hypothetical protein
MDSEKGEEWSKNNFVIRWKTRILLTYEIELCILLLCTSTEVNGKVTIYMTNLSLSLRIGRKRTLWVSWTLKVYFPSYSLEYES